ncbi:MAG: YCF48-related protein [candidate division Zixibacteria bacterium]|mgnify:CR=1 FL=1|nr:YCF48-related protein [candidate division Zixibacteria bacterium]
MKVSTNQILFSSQLGGSNPPTDSVVITNSGGGEFTFSATKNADWMEIYIINSKAPGAVKIEVYLTGLSLGEYIDTVTVTANDALNSPQKVEVRFTVGDAIVANPLLIRFDGLAGAVNPGNQMLEISSLSSYPIPATISENLSWLSLTNTSGTTPFSTELTADISGLPSGILTGDIVISSSDAANSPYPVRCTFAISSWETVPISNGFDLGEVYFTSPNVGFAVGFLGSNPGFTGFIVKTTDGGQTWPNSHRSVGHPTQGITFIDTNNGWVVGDSGSLLFTTDAGGQWTDVPFQSLPIESGIDLWAVKFFDNQHGWIVGTEGTILATTNGGVTWLSQNSPSSLSLADVDFVSNSQGWIIGNNGVIMHTTNGGNTWASQTSGTNRDLWGISIITSEVGWIVGDNGLVLHTENGGALWTKMELAQINRFQDLIFVSPTHGWIVGTEGLILYTNDGGQNWQSQLSGTAEWLFSVFSLNNQLVWVVGENGVTLRTVSGGF